MSLLNRDYSGFFPFWTVPYSRLTPPWGYEMPLAALTMCHWLAKSATLTAALNYSLTAYGYDLNSPPQPPDTTSAFVGTITGSGTISNAATGSALMALAPAARAAYAGAAGSPSGLILLNSPPSGLVDSVTDTFTDSSNPSSNTTSSSSQPPATFSLAWFAGMPLADTLNPQGPVAFDPTANEWYTDLACSISGGTGPSLFVAETVNGGSSPASFILIADGVTLATVPLVASGGVNVTGNITLDIDTFWMP